MYRVNEEMKVAAAKYMEEQARVKADKEEKMTKFRDSASDAAARTLQQMYYVFSVSSSVIHHPFFHSSASEENRWLICLFVFLHACLPNLSLLTPANACLLVWRAGR